MCAYLCSSSFAARNATTLLGPALEVAPRTVAEKHMPILVDDEQVFPAPPLQDLRSLVENSHRDIDELRASQRELDKARQDSLLVVRRYRGFGPSALVSFTFPVATVSSYHSPTASTPPARSCHPQATSTAAARQTRLEEINAESARLDAQSHLIAGQQVEKIRTLGQVKARAMGALTVHLSLSTRSVCSPHRSLSFPNWLGMKCSVR